MNIKKPVAFVGAITALGVAGITGLSVVSAQSGDSGSSSLIDKIASKFNLNKEDVRAVFDEEKSARQAEREADFAEDLQDAVDAGDITAEQKTLIENKAKELREALASEREALETWAEQNGIDVEYLMFGRHDNDRLDDAVDDGDITLEQKTLIEDKQSELKDKRDEVRGALEQWAEDNDIDREFLRGLVMGGGHRGGHGGRL